MIKIYCFLSFFNFVFRQRRDQQGAFFGGIFPQKAEPQHRSQRAFRSECSSEPSLKGVAIQNVTFDVMLY